MAHRDIIVVGASAGGLDALQQLVAGFPRDLDAAVLAVLHTSNHSGSLLPEILNRAGELPVVHPSDKTKIERGRVYIAPPDNHMIVNDGHLRVIQGPRENLHRPAIDPLFRSAAATYGRRVIGVVLTGLLDDGTSGLMLVRAAGGEALVQDPETALFASMPKSALARVPDACVLPLAEIPKVLVKLTQESLPDVPPPPPQQTEAAIKETRIAEFCMPEIANEHRMG